MLSPSNHFLELAAKIWRARVAATGAPRLTRYGRLWVILTTSANSNNGLLSDFQSVFTPREAVASALRSTKASTRQVHPGDDKDV